MLKSNLLNRNPRKFFKKNRETGEKIPFEPVALVSKTIQSAFLPIEVHPPPAKQLGGSSKAKDAVEEAFAEPRFMTTGIPMGFSLAKVVLTDLGARCLNEALLDEVVVRRLPRGELRAAQNPITGEPGKILLHDVKGFHSLVIKYESLRGTDPDSALIARKRLETMSIPVDTRTTLCRVRPYPTMSALNGDDNIVVSTLRVAENFQRHLKKRGQGVETTKTAQSRRFVGYCQSFGRSPIAVTPEIILDLVRSSDPERLNDDIKWKYDPSEKPRIVFDSTRPRLYSQAFKCSDPSKIGQTGDTARGKSVSECLVHCTDSEKLSAQLVFQEAFPFTRRGKHAWFPEALGGLDHPHFVNFRELCNSAGSSFTRALVDATGEDPMLAHYAKLNLRRQLGTQKRKDVKTSYRINAFEFIDELNRQLPEKNQIEVFSFAEAKEEAVERLEVDSCKDSNPNTPEGSSPPATSVSYFTGETHEESLLSRAEKTKLHKLFTPIESFMRNFESKDQLFRLIRGEEIPDKKPLPHTAAKHTQRRVEAMYGTQQEEVPWEELPKTSVEALRTMVSDRQLTYWVRKDAADKLMLDASFSLKLLPGSLFGSVKDPRTVKGRKRPVYRATRGDPVSARSWVRTTFERPTFQGNCHDKVTVPTEGTKLTEVIGAAAARFFSESEEEIPEADIDENDLAVEEGTPDFIAELRDANLIPKPGWSGKWASLEDDDW